MKTQALLASIALALALAGSAFAAGDKHEHKPMQAARGAPRARRHCLLRSECAASMKTPMQPAASAEAPSNASRRRNGPKTKEDLRYAILRLQNLGLKISISAVAREVGVAAPLIHNTYPDIAEEIRRIAGRSTREQRDEKHSALVAERVANKALREVIATLKEDVDKLASINMTLAAQIGLLKAVAAGKVVQISGPGSAHE